MKGLKAALWTEFIKVRKSKTLPATIIIFTFTATMIGFLMLVAKDPEFAATSAIVKTKASFIAKADWPSFFNLLIQIVLTMGPIGFGIVTIWMFGREYSDRVIKDLLALPISRAKIVTAKFILILAWCLLLGIILLSIGILIVLVIGLDGLSMGTMIQGIKVYFGSTLLSIFLVTPVALVTSIGRGYLLPIGIVIIVLIITQILFVGAPNLTYYFPWAVPALFSRIGGNSFPPPGIISYFLFSIVCIVGLFATISWWKNSDQK